MKITRIASLLAFLVLASAGCYTLLSHPEGSGHVDYDRAGHAYYRDCRDCHVDYYFYHSGYRWNRPYYGSYYRPWWYNDYWFYGPYGPDYWPDGDGEAGTPPPQGSWSDHRRRKPSGDGEPLVGNVPDASVPGSDSSRPSSQNQGSESQGDDEDSSTKPEKKKDEGDRKKPRRKR